MIPLACPSCRVPLSGPACPSCGRSYPVVGGFPDLRDRVDPGEIEAYDRITRARHDAPPAPGTVAALEVETCVRRIVDLNLSLLPDVEGRDILEVGTGTGRLAAALLARGARVHAVDFSPGSLEAASTRAPGASLALADARALPFPDASFDVALASEVIEHVPETGRFLAELRRVLKPGGRAVLSTPSANLLLYPRSLLGGCLRPAGFLRRWRGDHSWSPRMHDRILRPGRFRRELAQAGFEVESWDATLWYFEGGVVHPLARLLEPLAPGLARAGFAAYLRASERLVRTLPALGIRQGVRARKSEAPPAPKEEA